MVALCQGVDVSRWGGSLSGVDVSRWGGSVSGGGGEQMGWQCVRGLR